MLTLKQPAANIKFETGFKYDFAATQQAQQAQRRPSMGGFEQRQTPTTPSPGKI